MSKKKQLSRRYAVLRKTQKKRIKFHFHGIKHHPLIIPVVTFLFLFFLSSVGMVLLNSQTVAPSDSHSVTVLVDDQSQTIPTRAKTVKDLLSRMDITVNDQDIVEPAVDTKILEDSFKVRVLRARPVTIVDNGRKITVLSAHQQPRTVVEKAGITMYPEDGIKQAETTDVAREAVIGENIEIDRAVNIELILYGTPIQLKSKSDNVQELLDDKSIKVSNPAQVFPSLETKLTPGLKVAVAGDGKKVKVAEEIIAHGVESRTDPTLPLGELKVVQEGSPGKKVIIYEVSADLGVGEKPVGEFVTLNPVKRIELKGSKALILGSRAEWLVAAGVSPVDYAAVDHIISKESGWCPTKWQGEYGGCPAYHGTPTSTYTGYGLCQSTPGSKMAEAGADWGYNPVTQLKWCSNYAKRKFGGWRQAYNFWVVNHWW